MSAVDSQQSIRLLWVQVVLQAKSDLENAPIGSILFDQAAAFFVGRGEWAVSRATVADCLEMHPDDLYRCGERWIAERRQREGLPPVVVAAPQARTPRALPRLEAFPAPDTRARNARRNAVLRSGSPVEAGRVNAAAGPA